MSLETLHRTDDISNSNSTIDCCCCCCLLTYNALQHTLAFATPAAHLVLLHHPLLTLASFSSHSCKCLLTRVASTKPPIITLMMTTVASIGVLQLGTQP